MRPIDTGPAVAMASGEPRYRPPPGGSMRFGLISHIVGDGDSAGILRDTIELATVAEETGYDSFWVAQHHFGAQRGHCPSPLVLLAAIAQRTTRIRLGTAVVVGSLEDPIRLAEDAATVDALSGGRLELGLGAGADEQTSHRFGRDHLRRHEQFADTLHQLRELLSAGSDLVPNAPGLRDRLWIGTSSEQGFALAADLNLGVLTGRTSSARGPRDEIAARRVDGYLAAQRRHGRAPRVGVSRSVLCAESERDAFAAMRLGIERWVAASISAGRFPADFTADDYVRTGHCYLGTGPQIAEMIAADPVVPAATEFLCNVQPAAPAPADIRRSVKAFAEQVIPGWGSADPRRG
ncbi:LLM class flavin-dependent oxidoreductase [Nocardia carnea]|uniref:LLM class flavin-dependent oxidoreductase n=1 Tax=Nocardia carnea TaxID=37328 RepID=A0ABW7TTS2_9NOCA|nr:LLM class flavin-dependent oxidoreductase [Nocardia carnea]